MSSSAFTTARTGAVACLLALLCACDEEKAPPVNEAATDRHVLLADAQPALTFQQNWTNPVAAWWYNTPQGSKLLPYDWFRALKSPAGDRPFNDPEHIRSFGFIPRAPDVDGGNPHGLPVGFTLDRHEISERKDLGKRWPLLARYDAHVGLTCAACHSSLITITNRTAGARAGAYIVDGAQSYANAGAFVLALAESLEKTLQDPKRFDAFVSDLQAQGTPPGDRLKEDLRLALEERRGYNQRNLAPPGEPSHGFARIDAFGGILNEVTAHFVNLPSNARKATAPVNYPFIWDASHHDYVQWPGHVPNRLSGKLAPAIVEKIAGTREIGALGRNAGEVMGVFGKVSIERRGGKSLYGYDSTVKRKNLIRLEETLATLWSPQLAEAIPQSVESASYQRGKALYERKCISCHPLIDRTSKTRQIVAINRNVGTDPTMILNVLGRLAETGELRGRTESVVKARRFEAAAPAADILSHMGQRVLIGPEKFAWLDWLIPRSDGAAYAGADLAGAIELPEGGFRVDRLPGEVVWGQDEVVMHFPAGARYAFAGKAFQLPPGQGVSEPTDRVWLFQKLDRVEIRIRDKRLLGGVILPGHYKARPLNGIWATAPYLHNGSVPTLYELLDVAANRPSHFVIKGSDFDDVMGGLSVTRIAKNEPFPKVNAEGHTDDGGFLFDTTRVGNANRGHEVFQGQWFVWDSKTPEGKAAIEDLVAYLKTL